VPQGLPVTNGPEDALPPHPPTKRTAHMRGRGRGHHPRERVVGLGGPAAGGGAIQGLRQHRGLHPKPGAQQHGLCPRAPAHAPRPHRSARCCAVGCSRGPWMPQKARRHPWSIKHMGRHAPPSPTSHEARPGNPPAATKSLRLSLGSGAMAPILMPNAKLLPPEGGSQRSSIT
jgi:hypothetical protein